jgi:hypothetical protein
VLLFRHRRLRLDAPLLQLLLPPPCRAQPTALPAAATAAAALGAAIRRRRRRRTGLRGPRQGAASRAGATARLVLPRRLPPQHPVLSHRGQEPPGWGGRVPSLHESCPPPTRLGAVRWHICRQRRGGPSPSGRRIAPASTSAAAACRPAPAWRCRATAGPSAPPYTRSLRRRRWGCRRWWARVLRVPSPQRFAPASRCCRCRPPLSPRFVLLLLLRLLLLLLLLPLLLLPGRQPTYRARGAVTNSVLKSGGPSRLQRLYLSSQHHVVAPGDIPLGGPLRQHGVQ